MCSGCLRILPICCSTLAVVPCNISTRVVLGSASSSHRLHIDQNDFDKIASLHAFVPITVYPSDNGITIENGNFSRFDASLVTNTQIIEFLGSSQFSNLFLNSHNGNVRLVFLSYVCFYGFPHLA